MTEKENHLRYQPTHRDRLRADRFSALCFNTNPINRIFFESWIIIITANYALKKCEGFCKARCFHSFSSTLTKNKRKKTINTAFISSHVCLKTVSQISVMCVRFIFTSKYIRGWEIIAITTGKKAITLKWKEELKFADTVL